MGKKKEGLSRKGKSRNVHQVILVLALSLVGVACGSNSPKLPDTTGSAVWSYLQEIKYQDEWELWPGKGEKFPGGEPHGALFTTYLNSAGFDALTGKAGVMPDGAIIVKENYTGEGVFDLITVMYKVDGYNPDNNARFWAKVKANGEVDAASQLQGCQACHGARRDNDFVLSGDLK